MSDVEDDGSMKLPEASVSNTALSRQDNPSNSPQQGSILRSGQGSILRSGQGDIIATSIRHTRDNVQNTLTCYSSCMQETNCRTVMM